MPYHDVQDVQQLVNFAAVRARDVRAMALDGPRLKFLSQLACLARPERSVKYADNQDGLDHLAPQYLPCLEAKTRPCLEDKSNLIAVTGLAVLALCTASPGVTVTVADYPTQQVAS